MGFAESIKKGLQVINDLVPILGSTFASLFIIVIVLGKIYNVAIAQSLIANFTAMINGTLAAITSAFTELSSGVQTAVSLLPLVIILLLFGFMIWRKEKSKKSGNSGSDMNFG